MSYCRMSSDDRQSDVYVYGDITDGRVVVSVGHTRRVYVETLPPPLPALTHEELEAMTDEEYTERSRLEDERDQKVHDTLHETIPMPEPYCDVTRRLDTREALKFLHHLREEGYHIPQRALDRLEEDVLTIEELAEDLREHIDEEITERIRMELEGT